MGKMPSEVRFEPRSLRYGQMMVLAHSEPKMGFGLGKTAQRCCSALEPQILGPGGITEVGWQLNLPTPLGLAADSVRCHSLPGFTDKLGPVRDYNRFGTAPCLHCAHATRQKLPFANQDPWAKFGAHRPEITQNDWRAGAQPLCAPGHQIGPSEAARTTMAVVPIVGAVSPARLEQQQRQISASDNSSKHGVEWVTRGWTGVGHRCRHQRVDNDRLCIHQRRLNHRTPPHAAQSLCTTEARACKH